MSNYSASSISKFLNSKAIVASKKKSAIVSESDEVDLDKVDVDLEDLEGDFDAYDYDIDDFVAYDLSKEELDEEEFDEDDEVLEELDKVEEDLEEDIEEDVEVIEENSLFLNPLVEELNLFFYLEKILNNFILDRDVNINKHPKLREFVLKSTEMLDSFVNELRNEKTNFLFDKLGSLEVDDVEDDVASDKAIVSKNK